MSKLVQYLCIVLYIFNSKIILVLLTPMLWFCFVECQQTEKWLDANWIVISVLLLLLANLMVLHKWRKLVVDCSDVLWCYSLQEVYENLALDSPVDDVIVNMEAAAWLVNGIWDHQMNVLLFGRLKYYYNSSLKII